MPGDTPTRLIFHELYFALMANKNKIGHSLFWPQFEARALDGTSPDTPVYEN